MGELRGFIEYDRKTEDNIDPAERIKNYKEFAKPLSEKELNTQGARCMDCGIPFCHTGGMIANMAAGCPVMFTEYVNGLQVQ